MGITLIPPLVQLADVQAGAVWSDGQLPGYDSTLFGGKGGFKPTTVSVDLSGYALLAGRAGGQALKGGTAASENLTLQSTAHATKGWVIVGEKLLITEQNSGGLWFTDAVPTLNTYEGIYSTGGATNLLARCWSLGYLGLGWRNNTGSSVDCLKVYGGTGFLESFYQQRFSHLGGTPNDLAKYSVLIQPSGALNPNWGPLAICLTSGATSPDVYFTSTAALYIKENGAGVGAINATSAGGRYFYGGRSGDGLLGRIGLEDDGTYGELYLGNGTGRNVLFSMPAANTLAISTGGVEALRVTSGQQVQLSGHLGINVAPDSTYLLRIKDAASGAMLYLETAGANSVSTTWSNPSTGATGYIQYVSAGHFEFTPGVLSLRLTNSGPVNTLKQHQFTFIGATPNDSTQDALQIKPGGAQATNYRPFAIYNSTWDPTLPNVKITKDGALYLRAYQSSNTDDSYFFRIIPAGAPNGIVGGSSSDVIYGSGNQGKIGFYYNQMQFCQENFWFYRQNESTVLMTLGTGNLTIPQTVYASANFGMIALGNRFSGGANNFAGAAAGTFLAVNAENGNAADFFRFQAYGVDKAWLNSGGNLYLGGTVYASGAPLARKVYSDATVPGGDTVANTAAETAFASVYTVPANSLKVGDFIRVTLRGVFSQDVVPATLRARVRFGGVAGTLLLDSGALSGFATVTNAGWKAEVLLGVTAIGAAGTIECQAYASFATAAATALTIFIPTTAAVTVDTTASKDLAVTVQWGTAAAANSITVRQMLVEIL